MKDFLKNYRHILVALFIFLLFKMLVPPVNGLTAGGVTVLGIFIATVYMWITVGTDWPSFLCVAALCCVSGTLTSTQVFSSSFGSFMLPLMIGVMLMNDTMANVGITRNLATWFITRKIVKNRPWVFVAMYLLAGMALMLIMEMIPPIIIMLAIADSLFEDLGYKKGDSFPQALILGLLWTSVITFGSSPLAHSTIVMMIGLIEQTTGVAIPFFQYMLIGLPFALLFFGVTMLVLRFVVRPDVSKFINYDIDKKKDDIQPLSSEAKAVLVVFTLVVLLWMLPDLGSYVSFLKPISAFLKPLGPAFPPIVGSLLMAIIKVNGQPLLKFGESLKRVQWGAVIFCSCVMLLSSCMGMESTGISTFFTNLFEPLGSSLSPMLLIAVACLAPLIMTNFMSSSLTGTLAITGFSPILMATSTGAANMPLVVSMGVGIMLMAETAFLTPPANPSAPLMYSSGYLPTATGLKYGWIMMLAGYVILILIIAPWSRFVLGA